MFEADSSLDITFEFNWIALDPPTIEVNALNVLSNDRVDDAVDLGTAAIVSATGSNHRATTDDQEARLTDSNTPVVWWRWTAPHSGVFALDSTGTDFFHSILVVREPGTSTQEQEWQRLLRVDGIGEPFPNKQPIAFTADMGATYLLGIGGNTGSDRSIGNIQFSLSAIPDAPHDLQENAVDLGSVFNTESTQSLERASVQAGEPTVGETALHQRTVWWRWTAPDDAFVWVSVQPTLIIDGDTFSLSVFPAHSSVDIAGRGRAEKRFNFRAIAGEQYRIALARGLESTPANQQIRPEALGTDVTLHIASFVATAGDSYASRIDLGNATHVMVEGHTYFATSDADDPVTSPETV